MAKLLGKAPNQVPTNADLGSMAFQDREGINVNTAVVANLVVTGATSVNTTFAVTNATSNVAFFASNGNVGFTTSAPRGTIDVYSNVAYFGAFNTTGGTSVIVDSPSAQTAAIFFRQAGGNAVDVGTRKSNTSVLTIRESASGVERITFVASSTAGAIGINNTAPDATLAVTGTANISGNVVIGGSTRIYGPQTTFGGNSAALWTGAHLYANASTRSLILYAPAAESTGAPFIFDTPNAIEFRLDSSPILTLNSDYTTTVNSITTFSKDVIMSGNLTVSGTTTYINTTQLNIGDNIITLNADLPGATAPTENAGWEVNRGSSSNVSFIWDETNQGFKATAQAASSGTSLIINSLFGESNKDLLFNYNDSSQVGMIRVYGRPTTPSNAQHMAFWLNNGTSLQQRMLLVANGNFGIGDVTGPISDILHLRRDSTGNMGIIVQNRSVSGTPEASIKFLTGGVDLADSRYSEIASAGSTSSDLSFRTALGASPTTKMYIGANGNIGIGNTAPAQKLVVAGTANVSGVTYHGANVIFAGGAGAGIVYNATADGSSILSKPMSNSTVSQRLDILGVGANNAFNPFWSGIHLSPGEGPFTNASSGNAFPRLSMYYSYTNLTNPTDLVFNFVLGNASGIPQSLRLYSSNTAGGQSGIDIAANGNVGIGTTAPSEKLSISGVVAARVASNTQVVINYLENSDGGTGASAIQRLTAGTNKSLTLFASGSGYSGMYGTATAPSFFYDFDSHAFRKLDGTTLAVFASNGNIGFGNSTPTSALQVTSTATAGAGATIARFGTSASPERIRFLDENGTGSLPPMITSPSASFGLGIAADQGTGPIIFYTGGTANTTNEKVRLVANGNFGINTTAPYEKLMVNNGNGIITNEDSSTRFSIVNRGNNTTARFPQLIVQHHSGNTSGGDTGGQPVVELIRLRGNTSVIQAIASGDVLGGFNTWGSNATSTLSSTRIQGIAEANFTTTATAGLQFLTTNAGTQAEVVRMSANGNVGIGNTTPADKLSVTGTINATGSISANNIRRYVMTRALSTTTNDTIEIGTLTASAGGAHDLLIAIQVTDSGFSVAKQYHITSSYNATNGTTYRRVLPQYDTGVWTGNDFDLEAYHNADVIGLRLRRTGGGTTVGTAEILIDDLVLNNGTDSFTPSSTTATGVAAVAELFPGNRVLNTGYVHATPNTFIVAANATTNAITSNNTVTALNLPVSFGSYTSLGFSSFVNLGLTTSATTANQVLSTFGASGYRSAKFFVQVTSGSAYQATEITLIHDGTNVYKSEYGQVFSGAVLATFDADINSGNVRLLTTPTNAVTVYKGLATQILI